MEAPLEIRYAGVVIGRAQDMRSAEGDAPSFFIPIRDPMPVGTVLRLRAGDRETPVRVVRAVESADAAICGMQVRTIGDAEEVSPDFIPPPALLAEKVKPAKLTPVVEIDMEGMDAGSIPAEAVASAETPVVSEKPAIAEAPAPAKTTAEAAPADTVVSPPGGTDAVPEAVPLAIASSMTGALENATKSVPESVPMSDAQAAESVPAAAPAGPRLESASSEAPQPEKGSVAATVPSIEDDSAAMATTDAGMGSAARASEQTSFEDLPPARPIEPSGRRKTRRRR